MCSQKFKSRWCKRGRQIRPRNLLVHREPVVPKSPTYAELPTVSSEVEIVDTPKNEILLTTNIEEQSTSAESETKNFLYSVLQENGVNKPSTSIITSATQLLMQAEENQWLNNEVIKKFPLISTITLKLFIPSVKHDKGDIPLEKIALHSVCKTRFRQQKG